MVDSYRSTMADENPTENLSIEEELVKIVLPHLDNLYAQHTSSEKCLHALVAEQETCADIERISKQFNDLRHTSGTCLSIASNIINTATQADETVTSISLSMLKKMHSRIEFCDGRRNQKNLMRSLMP